MLIVLSRALSHFSDVLYKLLRRQRPHVRIVSGAPFQNIMLNNACCLADGHSVRYYIRAMAARMRSRFRVRDQMRKAALALIILLCGSIPAAASPVPEAARPAKSDGLLLTLSLIHIKMCIRDRSSLCHQNANDHSNGAINSQQIAIFQP